MCFVGRERELGKACAAEGEDRVGASALAGWLTTMGVVAGWGGR
jgi:hypothetical protein